MWFIFPFFWLFFIALFFFVFRFWGCGWGWRGRARSRNSDEILRSRVARGEIDEAEYQRLREILAR